MEVLNKVKSGEYSAIEATGSSDVWKNFKKIINSSTLEIVPYVLCERCQKIFKFGKGSIPSNLKKHTCYKRLSENENLTETKRRKSCVFVNEEIRNEVTRSCVEFVARDLRSFDAVNGSGFKDMARCLIEVGVKLGTKKFSIDILPHSTTISRTLLKVHTSEREIFVNNIRPYMEKG
ncbi:PREDICTED: uncharacterized protein LOC108362344 [Rhagoletis zephyria]|uniref:uncharacterized protein LOC108362344 n=1 Tax=Rhagoletis zephyria TaxID=28612 RepID=UPI000811A853|nr:PREDICTED: uncharacterized protein LOC108362344 [Rhagoletis zephyria]